MRLSTATTVLLAQTAVCEMAAREAKITPAAALLDRRAPQKDQCDAGKTACGDGNGCCPRGSKCTTTSGGVGVCADACYSATLFCSFGSGIELCCQPGAGCDYSRSVCTQHSTDKGGVWTSPSTSAEGSPLPTAPVFSSTSGQDDETTTTTTTESGSSQTSQSSTETDASTGSGSGSSSGAGATATKNPKDSGSAVVASWSAGVLALVFGIMVAL